MSKLICGIVLFCLVVLAVPIAEAQSISNYALFNRCYSQVTQTYAGRTNPIAQAVMSGSVDPITACLEVLDKAKFSSGNTQIASTSDPEAVSVLETMHKLHFSWFQNQYFSNLNQVDKGNKEMMDSMAPALYITRSLFATGVPYSSIMTETQNLRAIRSIPDKNSSGAFRLSPLLHLDKSAFEFGGEADFTFAPQGDLWGVEYMPKRNNWTFTSRSLGTYTSKGFVGYVQPADFTTHFGGGIGGSQEYLLLNIGQPSPYFKDDGALQSTRKISQTYFNDILCRQLPVIRQATDADTDSVTKENFISSAGEPYRQSNACTQCHASIDRLSFVYRNYHIDSSGGEQYSGIGGAFVYRYPAATQPAETSWPLTADTSFSVRPTNGTFYYRTFDGTLVNQKLTSPADLGSKVAALNDPYVCAAKRYYEYFTGIQVDIGDIGDPAHGSLTAQQMKYRNNVISLGRALKSDPNQSLRTLIENILRSTDYKSATSSVGGL